MGVDVVEGEAMKKTALFALAIAFIISSAVSGQAYEEISPSQAYEMMILNPNVYIIDVRTPSEWIWVGLPDKSQRDQEADLTTKIINVPYLVEYKGGKILNENFLLTIHKLFDGDPSITLITMCKNESRSKAAAAMLEAAGYTVFTLKTGARNELHEEKAPDYRTVSDQKKESVTFSYNAPENYTR